MNFTIQIFNMFSYIDNFNFYLKRNNGSRSGGIACYSSDYDFAISYLFESCS